MGERPIPERSATSGVGLRGDDGAARAVADRLASLGTLVASVAHEINNPITYVLGNLGELERLATAMREGLTAYRSARARDGAEPDAAVDAAEDKIREAGGLELLEELLADIYEGSLRIRDLVRDLLTLSRPAERSTAPLNAHEILDSAIRLVSRKLAWSAHLERDYRATRLIDGDRAKLGQVFLNLLTNAVQACQPPDPERHSVAVRTRDLDGGIEIEIEDSGPGMPEELGDTVFAPFVTTKEGTDGTGLGLYISRRIVQEHGGALDFRPRPGGGTIFRVALPGPSS